MPSMSWNLVRFHEIHFQTNAESFSFLSWKRKMLFFQKVTICPPSLPSRTSRYPRLGCERLGFVESHFGICAPQNLLWKLGQHSAIWWNSLGLFRDCGMNHIPLGIFFLFFKIKSWNFQHLYRKGNHETS